MARSSARTNFEIKLKLEIMSKVDPNIGSKILQSSTEIIQHHRRKDAISKSEGGLGGFLGLIEASWSCLGASWMRLAAYRARASCERFGRRPGRVLRFLKGV